MKKRINFIERRTTDYSIENVFREVGRMISKEGFELFFRKVRFGSSLFDIVRNLVFFKREAADIYHVTGHVHYMVLRLPRDRTVLTIHDLRFLYDRKGLRRLLLKKLFLDWPVKRANYITAVSQKTKEEIVANTNCDDRKIRVIENPVFADFLTGGELKPLEKRRPVILQIGYTPNKNIPRLIDALAGLKCKLIIVGGADENLLERLRRNKIDHEIKEKLDQQAMADEYRNCDIVAFCSTYEGFGLPIIEAQALGKPLVTSDLRPMTDIAGDGAIFVDPRNVASIRAGILRVIEDDELRRDIVQKGFQNVSRFDPSKIGKKYEDCYREILAECER